MNRTLGPTVILVLASGAALGGLAAACARRLAGRRIALAIPTAMVLGAVLTLWAWAYDPTPCALAASAALATALLTLALVDIAVLRLPDIITLPLIAAGLILASLQGADVPGRLVGAAAGWASIAGLAAAFRRLRGRHGLGLGDAKLLAAAGAWLGWRALPWTVLAACALGFAWVGVRAIREGQASFSRPLPFGAAIALAFWIQRVQGAAG